MDVTHNSKSKLVFLLLKISMPISTRTLPPIKRQNPLSKLQNSNVCEPPPRWDHQSGLGDCVCDCPAAIRLDDVLGIYDDVKQNRNIALRSLR